MKKHLFTKALLSRNSYVLAMIVAILLCGGRTANAQYFQPTQCSGTPSTNLGTTTYVPMNSTTTAGGTNRMAIIYPASQLTGIAGGQITNVYFYKFSGGAMGGTPNFKIYLKETSATDFGSGSLTWATEIGSLTPVYNANPASLVTAANGWINLTLSTPFTYSGTQNLAVYLEYSNPGTSSTINWAYEYTDPCINSANSNTTKYINNTTGTPGATLSSSNYRRPYIGFDILLSPCVAPTAQPTALNLTSGATAISGSFTAASPAAQKYLVVRTSGAPLNTSPVNGTAYTAGGTLGNGTVVSYGTSTTFNNTSLSGSTSYTYTIFSANDQACSGGPLYLTTAPLTGTISTAAPVAYTWNATTGTADATLPGSWTPARNFPDVSDTLYFNNGGTSTVTGLATSTVAKVVVANNTSVTFNSAATATISISRELNVAAGSTLEMSGANGLTVAFLAGTPAPTATIAGTLNLSGTGTCTYTAVNSATTISGTVNVSNTGLITTTAANTTYTSTGTLNWGRNGGTINAATYHPASNINVTGIVGTIASFTSGIKPGNLTWVSPSQTVAGSLSSTIDSVLGNLTIISTGTGSVEGGNTPNIQVMGNFVQVGGTFTVGNYTSTSGIIDVYGNVNLVAGTLNMSTAASGTATYEFRANGPFIQDAGHTITRTASVAGNLTVITFGGTTAGLPIILNGTTTTHNISYGLNNPAGRELNYNLTVNPNASVIMTAGNWSGTGSFTYGGTNTLIYNGSAAQTASAFEYPATGSPASLTIAKINGSILTMPFSRTVTGTLTMTSGEVDLGANELILGVSATAPGTISGTGGFIRSGTFTRWFNTTGLPTTAGTGVGYFPMGIGGDNRNVSIYFSTATALTAGGTISVTHNNTPGFTTGLSVVDGTYTINNRPNANWVFATGNGITLGGTASVRLTGANMFQTTAVANIRVMQPNAVVGTHANGTGSNPNYQAVRTGLTLANLTTAPLHIGANATDISVIYKAINTGDWNTASTWDVNAVPTAADIAIITSGTTVNVPSGTSTAKTLNIASGGTLNVSGGALNIDTLVTNSGTVNLSSGSLTMGADGFNNKSFISQSGSSFNVSGGAMNMFGNILINSGANFSQSGGTISIDGNNAGTATRSVASGTDLFGIGSSTTSYTSGTLAFTGGTIIFVDPPFTTSTTTYALGVRMSSATTSATATNNHTFQFGNGISTDAGGVSNGFNIGNWVTTGGLTFGNMVVNAPPGTNRNVTDDFAVLINGNLTIQQGEVFFDGTTTVGGNLTVNGDGVFTKAGTGALTFTSTGNILTSTTFTASPVTTGQTMSGSGTFRNLQASPTANIAAITVNNSSAAGVTFANDVSFSGITTFILGKIVTGNKKLIEIAGASSTGASQTTGWVYGTYQKAAATGTMAHTFPIGDANYYTPVVINGGAGTVTTAGSVAVKTTAGDHPNMINGAAGIASTKSVNRYYTITKVDGVAFAPNSLSVTLNWNAADVDAGANTANFIGAKYDAPTWTLPTVGTKTATSIVLSGISDFSDFQVGEAYDPLAIKLVNISAANVGTRNRVDWTSAVETAGDYYELERSADGKNFVRIATIEGKGKGGDYTYFDQLPLSGVNYYRLKMVNIDAQAAYSRTVTATAKANTTFVVEAYPNPVTDKLTVNVTSTPDGKASINLIDLTGKVVRSVDVNGTSAAIDMNGMPAGIYMLQYRDASHDVTVKITKQ